MEINIKNSVGIRQLVEFVVKSGDLNPAPASDHSALEGARIHRRIQKGWDDDTKPEVSLKQDFTINQHTVTVHGRADGVKYTPEGAVSEVIEIKTSTPGFDDLATNTLELYWSQAKFYAYMLMDQNNLEHLKISLIYYQVTTRKETVKTITVSHDTLASFVEAVIFSYTEWLGLQEKLHQKRDQSIKQLDFPFPRYRKNQRAMAGAVYKTIVRQKKLLVEAPTGTGKTISTLFPAIKALGEGASERIFYLTAKQSTRAVAQAALELLVKHKLDIRAIVLTAKDQIAFSEEKNLADDENPFYLGYYDRIKPAITDILLHEKIIDRDTIEEYARKYTVDPFEYSLDISLFCDVIICDYNYLFDPLVYLQRFFSTPDTSYSFLIDEAHNLVDRSRRMYTKEIGSGQLDNLIRVLQEEKKPPKKLVSLMTKVLNSFDALKYTLDKYDQDSLIMKDQASSFNDELTHFCDYTSEWLRKHQEDSQHDAILDYFLEAHAFLKINEFYSDAFRTRLLVQDDELIIKTFCLDSSKLVASSLKLGSSTVFFSATLSPLSYYQEMFGIKDDSLIYRLPSPFPPENLGVFITGDIQTTYQARQSNEGRVIEALGTMVKSRPGNYLVFLPSYSYLNEVAEDFAAAYPEIATVVQTGNMDSEAREEFLDNFKADPQAPLVGFAVLGGIFAEGIDLKGSRLIGVAVISVGLPRLNPETDQLRDFFASQGYNGFQYAYQLPGLNKVFQAAGRVIRDEHDVGVILLIDSRFASRRYTEFYPQQWQHFRITYNQNQLQTNLNDFWQHHKK